MRNLRVLGLAILALFAVGAVASASASAALPQVLVASKPAAVTFKGIGGIGTLQVLNGTAVKCEKSASTTEIGTNGESGTFHVEFSGKCHVTFLGTEGPCTGLGDKAETILALGKVQFVYDNIKTGELGVAAHLTLETVHFECTVGTLKVLVVVTGDLLCLVSPLNTLTTKSTLVCSQSKGDASETKYHETTEGAENATSLKSAESEKTAESAGQETTENLVSFVGGKETAATLDG